MTKNVEPKNPDQPAAKADDKATGRKTQGIRVRFRKMGRKISSMRGKV